MSFDGIKVTVNIEFDQAEVAARRYSSSPVLVNDSIRLEYQWMTLMNGDTLTFSDGSRYTFYNLYNVHEIDEIPVGSDAYIRYCRRNMIDEDNKLRGEVQMLKTPMDFDEIRLSEEAAPHNEEEGPSDSAMDEEDDDEVDSGPFLIGPNFLSGPLPPTLSAMRSPSEIPAGPEPLDEITPEVSETDAKELQDTNGIAKIQKDIMEKVQELNSKVSELVPPDDLGPRRGTGTGSANPYDDGESSLVELEKKDKMKLKTVLDEKRKKRITLPMKGGFGKNMIVFPPNPKRNTHQHLMMRRHALPMEDSKPETTQFDNETYVLYRSKNKLMPAAHDIYDVRERERDNVQIIIDTYCRDMMDGIDMDDIRA